MNCDQALEILQKKISGPRYDHTVRVMNEAVQLAEKYGADKEKAKLAAIFHDYAKLEPIHELKSIITSEQIDSRLLDFHPELWHGPAAVPLVQKVARITDEDILNAIRYHTTGRANMSLLEKIIYVADYIEPGRVFEGVEEVRDLARVDINLALAKALGNTITFLVEKKSPIFPDTFAAYNDLTMKMGGSGI